MEKVIVGKRGVIIQTIVALLAEGHILIEDVPGLGKTMLARALAGSIDVCFSRIQFTPDLLPSDVTGVSIFNQKTMEFEFRPGPVFTEILLADEINRTTPRTQSSLLECMAERQITVDGHTRQLGNIFMVIATQNPIDLQGTYPLPEAQLDRFFMRVSVGYPSQKEEEQVLLMQMNQHPIGSISPVISAEDIIKLREQARSVHISKDIMRYLVSIVRATRENQHLQLGSSPRGSIALMRAAQALALISGKPHVEPDHVKKLVKSVLAHRLILTTQAQMEGLSIGQILEQVMDRVTVPVH
ncbi:MAG: MoxR family ATPase [Proteobacteria bacterium]|nr:MoxR family ATPase [Pseudomonadota bacterium]MBU1714945.1 MoxR family ATPase [Pseudomonadota bacterium]